MKGSLPHSEVRSPERGGTALTRLRQQLLEPTIRPFAALLLALPLLGAAAPPRPTPDTVDYRLSPVIEAGALTALAVEIRLRGDADGSTTLELPDQWASEFDLWKGVRDLRVEGATRLDAPSPAERVIAAPPGAPLVVRYRVVAGSTRELNLDETQPFKVHLAPGWVYTSGEAVFALLKGGVDRPARFDWADAPPGFAFASDLEHLAGAHGRAALRPGVVGDVAESVILAGRDVTVFTLAGRGAPVRMAARGRFAFQARDFATLLAATLREEQAFWGDRGRPFLVTLGPVEAPAGAVSLGGTGRTDGFMLAVTGRAPIELLRKLMAHEYFHTWNARELGGLEGRARESAGYWFSEGFTDFYAWRLLVRSGRLTPAEWAETWNDMLAAYGASPVRDRPDAEVRKDFWTNEAAEKLPYQRGALLAAIWDARLRASSQGRTSLDDVLRAQRREAAKARPRSAAELFPKVAARFGLDAAPDVARHIDRGEPILLPADVFGPCARVETASVPSFDRGWDVAATEKAGAVAGLRPDSPAYAAGLRDGMVPLRREAGRPGDSRVEYAVRVRDGDAERVFRFKPEGTGRVTVQTVRIAPGADAKTCARSLSGLGRGGA